MRKLTDPLALLLVLTLCACSGGVGSSDSQGDSGATSTDAATNTGDNGDASDVDDADTDDDAGNADPIDTGGGDSAVFDDEPVIVTGEFCPALAAPTGGTVVSTAQQLVDAVDDAAAGATILIADGTYALNGNYLLIDVPNVTLRSQSGNRSAVIIDGNYEGGDIISIVASNTTIADLTVQRSHYHLIHVHTGGRDANVLNTKIYNVHLQDASEQAIKINFDNQPGAQYFPDVGEIACSRIELTDAGRPHVNPTISGCYTGGIDAHGARDWHIRDNLIEGFWCPNGLAEHGIHLWNGSRDPIIERNLLVNNARGIGLGLHGNTPNRSYTDMTCPGTASAIIHYGGIVRNNFFYADDPDMFDSDDGFEVGIGLEHACGAQVLHNTLFSTRSGAPTWGMVETRFSETSAIVKNNLGNRDIMSRNMTSGELAAQITSAGNITNATSGMFVHATSGSGLDLHLTAGSNTAVDTGATLSGNETVTHDFDGDARSGLHDVGADER